MEVGGGLFLRQILPGEDQDRRGEGFEGFLVADARAKFSIGKKWTAALGVENLGNDKYYLFHPFPQRTFAGELTYRW